MKQYPAVVDQDGDAFGVSFPDFPGCVSAGDTAEEAVHNAAEALSGHVAMMAADGDAIPEPTALVDVSWEKDENVVCVTLVAVALPGRKRRYNVTMDENLVAQIDDAEGNRSAFLEEAARAELARRG